MLNSPSNFFSPSDSVYESSLGAHTDEKTGTPQTANGTEINTPKTTPVKHSPSIEEVDDEDDLRFKEKEKLDLSGPLMENMIPTEWMQQGHFVCSNQGNQMDVKLQITMLDTQQLHSVTALLDTGCTGSSIDANFVKQNGINTK